MTRKSRNGITPEAVIQNLISSLDNSASEKVSDLLLLILSRNFLTILCLKKDSFIMKQTLQLVMDFINEISLLVLVISN